MKFPTSLSMDALLPLLDQTDAIIDVRSPSEFAEDHIPGASNFPVLDDAQRVQVGTLYKQVGAFEAKKLGAALVAQNIAHHLQTAWHAKPREWQPLLYCWRGGNRSGSVAHVLAKIGWPVLLLEGGYKEYRRHVVSQLPSMVERFSWRVVCGTTGSGKSRLLHALAAAGAQVLDLEGLACHRGSVLGHLPDTQQPGQKSFESQIWAALRHFDPSQPVYVEAESKKVGNLRIPENLMNCMRNAPCLVLHLPENLRVALLLEDYAHFICAPDHLCQQLNFLRHQHGNEKILYWQQLVRQTKLTELIHHLLREHYDPSYLRSMERNFNQYRHAQQLHLSDLGENFFADIANELIAQTACK